MYGSTCAAWLKTCGGLKATERVLILFCVPRTGVRRAKNNGRGRNLDQYQNLSAPERAASPAKRKRPRLDKSAMRQGPHKREHSIVLGRTA